MPKLRIYSVDHENDYLHMGPQMMAERVGEAWFSAEHISYFSPDGIFVRVYQDDLPVLETRLNVTQFGLWHCHYEEGT